MVVIRLARQGRTKYPVYRIVAAESSRAVTGKFIAVIGNYNPHTKELSINHDEAKRFLGNGAQPSNTVAKLLQRDGVELPKWVKIKMKADKKVAEEVTEEEAAAEAPEVEEPAAEESEGTPVTEADEEARVAEVATDNEAEVEEAVPAVAAAEEQPDVDPESADALKKD